MVAVKPEQKHLRRRPCEVCGGGDDDRRGKGTRCSGYVSADGLYEYCTREEFAGGITPTNTDPVAYAHKRYGPCKCGTVHNPDISANMPRPTRKESDEVGRTVATYLYHDEKGRIAYRVTRQELADGEKSYRPWHLKDGRWVIGQGNVPRLLYRLPEVLSAPSDAPIYIPEGEKCVDTLAALGLVATTNSGGALKWHLISESGRREPLRGRHVVILPDNDPEQHRDGTPGREGQRHAAQIAADLQGIAASVKVVFLPDLPSKGDVVDWLAEARTRAQLEAEVAAAPYWTAADESETAPEAPDLSPPSRYRPLSRAELRARPMPEFLIDGILPEVGLAFLVGPPGSYKSFLAQEWGCTLACGLDWLGHKAKGGPVVYIAGEGVGGINKRITAWERYHRRNADDFWTIGEAVPLLEAGAVQELITQIQDCTTAPRVVIIDTLSRALVGGNVIDSKDVMVAIRAADRIRDAFKCLVLIVHHTNKEDDILGSISIPGGADTVISVKPDGEQITIVNNKMKEWETFAPFPMLLLKVSFAEDPKTTSLVLVPGEAQLLKSEELALTALSHFGNEGAGAVEWCKASCGPDLKERQFYNIREQMVEKDYVRIANKKYILAEYGRYSLDRVTTAPTALVLQSLEVQYSLGENPPLGGDSLPSTGGLLHPAAHNQTTTSAVPLRELPKGPCSECGMVSWARKPTGEIVCSRCIPPRTWQKQ